MLRAATLLALAVLSGLSACATPAPLPTPVAGVSEALAESVPSGTPIEDASMPFAEPGVRAPLFAPDLLPTEIADLPLTVFPTPRESAYGDVWIRMDDARVVLTGMAGLAGALERHQLLGAYDDLAAEGYVLRVTVEDGRGLVIVAARDPAGHVHALRALAQVSSDAPWGGRVARECLVIDAPAFPLRGSKRPQPWELAFGANFAWGATERPDHAERILLPFHAPGAVLDAGPAGVEAALAEFRPWQAQGVRRFGVKFDDVGFGLAPDTRLRAGNYPRAAVLFVTAVLAGLRERDPGATLYYLPQTYWWNDDHMNQFARATRLAGGLPRDVGLVMTGPEIISDRIDALGLFAARQAFGLTATKALIYDNLGREGDWGPLTGRDAGLVAQCDGVFGERGTPVNRLTRLDWSWNPWAYDAERSWQRALYELAGPYGYAPLRDACLAFRQGAARAAAERAVNVFARADLGRWTPPVPQADLVKLLRADLSRLPTGVSADASR